MNSGDARRPWVAPLLAFVIGAAAVSLLAVRTVGMGPRDAGVLAVSTLVVAGLAGGVGAFVLHLLRRRSVAVQAVAVALVTVAVVAAAATNAATMMFFSSHDLGVLLVVLVMAAAVGALAAMALGRRVGLGTRRLSDLAARIATGEPAALPRPDTAELASVAVALEEMAARLAEARERERAVEASRRELVAWVSHDLRTPLSGIRAMAEALEDGVADDPETIRRYHEQLRIETDRLSSLVDDLFELSRIQSGALRLEMERVPLGDIVSDALSASAPYAQTKRVKLQGRVAERVPPVPLSTAEFLRVLRNLLQNAIRHTPSDGTVWVETGLDGPHAFVSVADACGGIPQEDLGRVFDVAFRGQSARTPGPDGGAGLGLAIARGLVEAHRGKISVENVNGGCRFIVRVPLSA